MKELNRTQTLVYLAGAVLMVIGAGASLFAWAGAPYVFSLGALGFVAMQMVQRYDGTNFTIRRLRRIVLFSDFLLLLSGLLMFASMGNVFGLSQVVYVQYVYNKWVATLLIAAILQLYTAHRIDHELAKEAKKL